MQKKRNYRKDRDDINQIMITGYVSVPPVIREDMFIDFMIVDYNTRRHHEKKKFSFWCFNPVTFDKETLRYDYTTYKIMTQAKKGAKAVITGSLMPHYRRRPNGEIAGKPSVCIRVREIEMAESYVYMNAFNPYQLEKSKLEVEKKKEKLKKLEPFTQSEFGLMDEIDEYNNDAEVF